MAVNATAEARTEIAALLQSIEECRRELGISRTEASHPHSRRGGRFRRGLRGARRSRRRAPVAQ